MARETSVRTCSLLGNSFANGFAQVNDAIASCSELARGLLCFGPTTEREHHELRWYRFCSELLPGTRTARVCRFATSTSPSSQNLRG